MNEVVMLRDAEPREILKTAIEEKVPAIMSYLSKNKWHVTKVLLTNLGANRLNIEIWPREKPHPINIHTNQSVGVSIKYGYGKFVFDTTVVGLELSRGPDQQGQSGTIVLEVPDRIEIVQRRSYFRVDVPRSLKVNVLIWHRGLNRVPNPKLCDPEKQGDNSDEAGDKRRDYYKGRLVDISAGGAQIAVDTTQKPDFRKSQFIGLTFTPMPYEKPLILDAQIRNILPTADDKNICLGIQLVGLEASPEGRQVLQRLCNVVEHYFQITQSSAKQQEMKGSPNMNMIEGISEPRSIRTV
ncbi:MAG: flagellar brake protein [Planctomycetota bacterium]